MSVTESTQNNSALDAVNYIPLDFLSLNDLFNERFRKAQTRLEQLNLIVRCESLPRITGNREEITLLIDTLLSMILQQPPVGSKLFLYVDCEEMRNGKEAGRYLIKFHTNLTTNDVWKEVNREELALCERIVARHDGTFSVNNISNTGCLFSLFLPGKFQ